jgi:hypothetical protein
MADLQDTVAELSRSVILLGEKIRKQQIALDTIRVAVAVALDPARYEQLLETLNNLEKNQVETDSNVEAIRTAVAILDAVRSQNVGKA